MKHLKLITLLLLTTSFLSLAQTKVKKEMYELREYEMRYGSPQSNLDNYLKNALLPALNKYGVKNVGVFREVGKSDPAKIYLLIPFPSMEEYNGIMEKVKADEDFKKNSQDYNNLPPDKAPYARITTSFMNAFDGLPKLIVPSQEPRIFEIRTYESYGEDAARRKIKMFNDSELGIFVRAKLNSVFFGEVIAGEHIPCLTYMVTFKNMEERDANWKVFGADPEWKKISTSPEYANAMNRIIRVFLEPLAYSQI